MKWESIGHGEHVFQDAWLSHGREMRVTGVDFAVERVFYAFEHMKILHVFTAHWKEAEK